MKYEINYFYSLDSENKICFDCGGAFPTFVSINNGVFICKFCAQNHIEKLNYNISFIYDVNSEWDQYLLSYVTRGGNSRFKRLCNQYQVQCQSLSQNNDEKINKYIIRLGEYHRLVLKSEINCSEPPPILYQEVALNPIDINIIYFPEFEHYILNKGNITYNNNINNNNDSNTNMEDSMSSKIWQGTKNTFDIMKTTTGFIYNTSKPIVSFIGNAAFTGLKFIGNSVLNYMNDNNEKNDNTNNINNNNENNKNFIGNNTPINDVNYFNNEYNTYENGNNNNINNINMNNDNYFINNNSNNNYYPDYNKGNYLVNSNKFNIYTINDEKKNIYSNNQNNLSKIISKPLSSNNKNININVSQNIKNENKIPYFYDINSINNESINNISFYLNNNNNNINENSINEISNPKNLINHKNIIINHKYINNKNIISNMNNNINNKNKYPNFSSLEKNKENNINNNYFDKNVPDIIGEDLYQEKAKYPIYESINLPNENSFMPTQINTKDINE